MFRSPSDPVEHLMLQEESSFVFPATLSKSNTVLFPSTPAYQSLPAQLKELKKAKATAILIFFIFFIIYCQLD
jgi:hypothetical protein